MKNIYFLISLLLCLKSYGQDVERKKHYLFWTYYQKNVTTNGVSLGFGSFKESMNNYTNGLKIELIGMGVLLPLIPKSPIPQSEIEYENSLKNPISERINGIVLSGGGTVCDCITNGINVGLIGHLNRKVNGISLSAFANFAHINSGMQISAFNEAFYMNGLQVGLTNYSYYSNGLQIGLLNESKKLKGIQIGIWNINQKRKFPLINWNYGN